MVAAALGPNLEVANRRADWDHLYTCSLHAGIAIIKILFKRGQACSAPIFLIIAG
jgi:hypothetical protein